jgi:hypothetical protein
MPPIVSPRVNTDASTNATAVKPNPVAPRSSDAYRRGNFKITNDRKLCVNPNATAAATNPGTDNETLGTIQAATSSPVAHDARSATTRGNIRLMTTGVGRRALAG